MVDFEIKGLKISVTVDGEPMEATRVQQDFIVGKIPTFEFSLHEPIGKIPMLRDATGAEAMKRMEQFQENMFKISDAPNIKVSITDYEGKVLQEFGGYVSHPTYAHTTGSFGYGYKAISEYSRMFTLDTSVYSVIDEKFRLSQYQKVIEKSEGIIQLMSNVLESMVKASEVAGGSAEDKLIETADPLSHANRKHIRELNEVPLEQWYGVLERSAQLALVYPVFPEFKELLDPEKRSICKVVAAVYKQGGMTFHRKLMELCSMFQLSYIPNPKGLNAGMLISNEIIIATPESGKLDGVTASVGAGELSGMPITHVALVSPKRKMHRVEGKVDIQVVTSWPEKSKFAGAIKRQPTPAWLPISMEWIRDEMRTSAKSISPDEYKNRKLNLAKYHKSITSQKSAINKILRRYARNEYIQLALGNAVSSVRMPYAPDQDYELGFNLEASLSNDTKFTGVLHSLSHTLSINGDTGAATTNMVFKYVQAGNFKLPDTSLDG